jgi:glucose-6-phosphate dehydrogenase assembly protein OpcA
MAPDVAPIERLEEQPITLDPGAIEAEFSRIWQETTSAGLDESSVRLRVLNLVALASDAPGRERFEQVMEVLPQRHPCRGILLLQDPALSAVEAVISARCWRAQGGRRHVCSEEVLLSAGPGHERELTSAVLPLLVPDIPVVVWFSSAEPSVALASRLVDSADRVVFDSALAAGPWTAFDAAARLVSEGGVSCVDLAWTRLGAWRDLLAQSFDGHAAHDLEHLTSIEIAGSPDAAAPLLMAGWLVSRLALSTADVVRGGNDLRATLYDGTRAVSLAVRPEGSADLRAVRISTPGGRYAVALHDDSRHLHVDSPGDGAEAERRIVEAPPDDVGPVMVQALESTPGDTLYSEAVASAREISGR